LEELVKFRVVPVEGECQEEVCACNHALVFLAEYLIPGVCGARNWKEDSSSMLLSETKVTPSDIAFIALTYKNMKEKWDKGANANKTDRGRYTLTGSNRKFCGWSSVGIARYNELF
jgi:hypothetical protein